MPASETFIAYASADLDVARALADALRRRGAAVFLAPDAIRAGARWLDEIGDALARCDAFLVLLSPAAVESRWVRREVTAALLSERLEGMVIPVLLEDCDEARLSWVLPQLERIDLRGLRAGRPVQDQLDALLRALGIPPAPK